jgi:hypothetical protein
MPRRSTPENIDAAQRAGVRARLSGEGVDPDRAEAWIVAWEAREPRDVEQRGGDYWTAGWDWIAAGCGATRSANVDPRLRGGIVRLWQCGRS